MCIEIISDNTIKVTLDQKDLDDFGIKYRQLSRTDPETREFLLELLEIIQIEKGIDLCSEKLFIEAFLCDSGGCLLYISTTGGKIRKNQAVTPELTCDIFQPESLPMLAKRIFCDYSHLLHESGLYEENQNFRLILTVFSGTETRLINLLKEFGSLSDDPVYAAYTREHFRAVAERGAVEKLASIPRGAL